jgi:hypothetical protein
MPARCCIKTWNKIPADEPVFTLRAKDLLAPVAVKAWLDAAKKAGVNRNKLRRAKAHWLAMRRFQRVFPRRCKVPD